MKRGKAHITVILTVAFLLIWLTGCSFLPGNSVSVPDSGSDSSDQPMVPVVLYVPNESADGFTVRAAQTDGTAQHIVSLLVDEGALPAGCALLDFIKIGTKGGVADMNKAYLQSASAGTTGEYLSLGCVVNTLLTFFEIEEITITIEGETLETGHDIYDYPLHFFENQTAGNSSSTESTVINDAVDALAELPAPEALDYLWDELGGYWIHPDGYFIAFRVVNGQNCFAYGIFDTEYGTGFGELVSASYISGAEAVLSFHYPAQPGNELFEARPERTTDVYLDLTSLASNTVIDVKIADVGMGDYYSYTPHQD